MDIIRCRFQDFEVAGKNITLFPDVIKRVGRALDEENRYGDMRAIRNLSMAELRSLKRGRQAKLENLSDFGRLFMEPSTPSTTRRSQMFKEEEEESNAKIERRRTRSQSNTFRRRSNGIKIFGEGAVNKSKTQASVPLLSTSGPNTEELPNVCDLTPNRLSLKAQAFPANGHTIPGADGCSETRPVLFAAARSDGRSTTQLSSNLSNESIVSGSVPNGNAVSQSSSNGYSSTSFSRQGSSTTQATMNGHGQAPSCSILRSPTRYSHEITYPPIIVNGSTSSRPSTASTNGIFSSQRSSALFGSSSSAAAVSIKPPPQSSSRCSDSNTDLAAHSSTISSSDRSSAMTPTGGIIRHRPHYAVPPPMPVVISDTRARAMAAHKQQEANPPVEADFDVITLSDDDEPEVRCDTSLAPSSSSVNADNDNSLAPSSSSQVADNEARDFEESVMVDANYFSSIAERAKIRVKTRKPTPVKRVVTANSTGVVSDDEEHRPTTSKNLYKKQQATLDEQAPGNQGSKKTKKKGKKRKRDPTPDFSYPKIDVTKIQPSVPVRGFRTRFQEKKAKEDTIERIKNKALERQNVMKEIMESQYGADDKVIKFINFAKWTLSSPTRRICPKCQGRWFKVIRYWEENQEAKDWKPALVCYAFPCNEVVAKKIQKVPVGTMFGAPTKRAIVSGIDDFWNYTAENTVSNWVYQVFCLKYCSDLNKWRLGPFWNMVQAAHGMTSVIGQEELVRTVAPSLPVDYWKKPKMYKDAKDYDSNGNKIQQNIDLDGMSLFERHQLVQPPDDWQKWVIPGFDISNGEIKKVNDQYFDTTPPKERSLEQPRPDPIPPCSSKTYR